MDKKINPLAGEVHWVHNVHLVHGLVERAAFNCRIQDKITGKTAEGIGLSIRSPLCCLIRLRYAAFFTQHPSPFCGLHAAPDLALGHLHAPSAHWQSAPHLQASPHGQAAFLQALGHLHAPSAHWQSAPHLQASPHLHFVHAASAAHAVPMPDQANPNASKTAETTTRLLILIFIILWFVAPCCSIAIRTDHPNDNTGLPCC